MKLYVYCLAEGIDETLSSLRGIAGAPVRWLKTDEFWVAVSDLAADAVLVNRENVLAHAAVVQNVLDQTTPLPFRFATLVTEQRLEGYLGARREALRSKLGLVRGCVEMSVKIISEPDPTEESLDNVDQQQDKPGTAFLSEKRQEIFGSQARAAEAKRIAEWLEGRIREIVREAQINTNSTDKLILAAAHLVERDRLQQYRTKVAEARRERPELHFLVSGPWPPYSFANIDLEFKTHFGVS